MLKNKKGLACLFLVVLLMNIFFTQFSTINAAINEVYTSQEPETYDSTSGTGNQMLQWIGEFVYIVAAGVENLGAKVVSMFTGNEVFPWADKIIFNTMPILDVNFINPAEGSFFKDSDGQMTLIGETVRNTYFTVLSISVSFLGLIVGIMAIKLALASTGAKKAVYKEGIAQLVTALVMLFGLHIILSGMFYVNEKLVEAASLILVDSVTNDASAVIDGMSTLADEDNEKLVDNFLNECTKNCFLADIPLIGDLYKGLLNLVHAIGHAIEAVVNFFTGKKDASNTISKDDLGKIYPKKEDYVNAIKKDKTRINVAAYLLKSKYYRKSYLQWIKGNDTNKITESGLSGLGRNILISVNEVFGVADTGYKALRILYTSVMLVTYDVNNPSSNNRAFDSVVREGPSKEKDGYIVDDKGNRIKDGDGNDMKIDADDLNGDQYFSKIITSTEEYYAFQKANEEALSKLERGEGNYSDSDREGQILVYKLNAIYADAYYKYVYDGEDKVDPEPKDMVSEIATYFKSTAWFVDIQNKQWSPTSVSIVPCILYAILLFQSLVFFVAYIKRFFYVVILAIMGPAVVVYDFAMGVVKSL